MQKTKRVVKMKRNENPFFLRLRLEIQSFRESIKVGQRKQKKAKTINKTINKTLKLNCGEYEGIKVCLRSYLRK